MKILPSAVSHWEKGLGFECKNSTINLFRAVAPTLMSGIFCFLSAQSSLKVFQWSRRLDC